MCYGAHLEVMPLNTSMTVEMYDQMISHQLNQCVYVSDRHTKSSTT